MVTGVRNWENQRVQSVPAGGFWMVIVWTVFPVSGSVVPSVQTIRQGFVHARARMLITERKKSVLVFMERHYWFSEAKDGEKNRPLKQFDAFCVFNYANFRLPLFICV
jgi:hypothetical protein